MPQGVCPLRLVRVTPDRFAHYVAHMLGGMIFDIDGTLIDTNPSHVEAWIEAFAGLGYRIPADRVEREIGKGGDQLVPSVLGAEAERRDGDRLRAAQRDAFLRIAAGRR